MQQDYFKELANKLENTPFKERGKLIQESANLLRVTKKNIYEKLRKAGYTSGRKTRADYGKTKVSEELAMQVAGFTHLANRDNAKRIMPLKLSREILEANGLGVANEETGEIIMPSVTTLTRVMKQKGCHPSQLKVKKSAVDMRSLHPNHVWQMDASHCVLYYLPNGDVSIMEEGKFYKNKPHNAKQIENVVIVRYIIIDHYSGAFYLHYSEGAERAEEAIYALIQAMQYRSSQDPFRGVPKYLIMDKGSGNTSNMMESFLDNLGIEGITHEKGNPRAKGSVEQAQNLVETNLEGRFRVQDVANRSGLQALADKWRIWFCATKKHTRHNKTRFDMWQRISTEQLVMASSEEMLLESVSMATKEVKVNNRMVINLSTKTYGTCRYDVSLVPGIRLGELVKVYASPFKMHGNKPVMQLIKTMENGDKVKFEVLPTLLDEAGFNINAAVFGEEYTAKPKSISEKMEDKILKSAYNVESIEEAKKLHKKKAKPYQNIDPMADIHSTSHYFNKEASNLVTKEEIARSELPSLSPFEIGLVLRKKCPDWVKNPDEAMDWVNKTYPNGINNEQVIEAIKAFNNRNKVFGEVVFTKPVTKTILLSDSEAI